MDDVRRLAFLGWEFLLWLWFRSEAVGGFALGEDAFDVRFEDHLVLADPLAAEVIRFKGVAPTQTPEARLALRRGKRVAEAKLRVIVGDQEWSFVFRAADFTMRAVKLPNVLAKDDSERLAERMYLLGQLEQRFDQLYRAFLAVRTSWRWAIEELPALRRWMRAADGLDDGETDERPAQRRMPSPVAARKAVDDTDDVAVEPETVAVREPATVTSDAPSVPDDEPVVVLDDAGAGEGTDTASESEPPPDEVVVELDPDALSRWDDDIPPWEAAADPPPVSAVRHGAGPPRRRRSARAARVATGPPR
ncbi:MAG: hypothetical protein KC620_12460 [Myxococcales bacterium]|nr:hypothetical protein [Myxococcales bacterium]